MEPIGGVLKNVAEVVEKRVASPIEPTVPEQVDYLKVWWGMIQRVPAQQRNRFMGVLCKLRKQGVPEIALNEIARDYSKRWVAVSQPFAYYSQFGLAARSAIVRSNEQEYERLKKEWLAP